MTASVTTSTPCTECGALEGADCRHSRRGEQ